MSSCSIILTATNKKEVAHIIAGKLVKSGLARCVQIDKVTSIYEWKGEIEEEDEYRLFIKAADRNIDEIEKLIHELHNYELPEIISLNIATGSEKYINWLKR